MTQGNRGSVYAGRRIDPNGNIRKERQPGYSSKKDTPSWNSVLTGLPFTIEQGRPPSHKPLWLNRTSPIRCFTPTDLPSRTASLLHCRIAGNYRLCPRLNKLYQQLTAMTLRYGVQANQDRTSGREDLTQIGGWSESVSSLHNGFRLSVVDGVEVVR